MKELTREQVASVLYNRYHDELGRGDDRHRRTPWDEFLGCYPQWAAAWLALADETVGKGYKP